MIINTDALIRLLQNTTLFCGPKTQTGGVIHFITTEGGWVVATASDDYVIIQQSAKILKLTTDDQEFFLSHKYCKELLKELDDVDTDTFVFEDGEGTDNPNPELWEAVLAVPGERKGNEGFGFAKPCAVRPERLAKFSRIKAEFDYPLDLLFDNSRVLNHRDVIRWRFGPDVIGVLAPINRSDIELAFPNDGGLLWEE